MSSIQVYGAPLLHIDRVIQDLQQVMYELQDLEDTVADLNLPGITPSMLALSMPYGRILTAAKLHRLRIIVQLQRNLHQHWHVHFSPPPLEFNLMWQSWMTTLPMTWVPFDISPIGVHPLRCLPDRADVARRIPRVWKIACARPTVDQCTWLNHELHENADNNARVLCTSCAIMWYSFMPCCILGEAPRDGEARRCCLHWCASWWIESGKMTHIRTSSLTWNHTLIVWLERTVNGQDLTEPRFVLWLPHMFLKTVWLMRTCPQKVCSVPMRHAFWCDFCGFQD